MKRCENQIICVVVGLVFSSALVCPSMVGGTGAATLRKIAMNEEANIRVLWTVSEFHIGRKAEWGSEEAKRMLFKPLDVNSSSIVFDGQRCDEVTFSREEVNTAEYLEKQFQITPEELNLVNTTLTVVKTNCMLPGFKEYIRLPDRKLIVSIKGVLFVLEPVVNY